MSGLDLGIAGKTALVCGSTKGLGRACAIALADQGVDVVINGRGRDAVEQEADALAERIGREVGRIAADVTTAEGRALLLTTCPSPDILVTNAAGPPAGSFADWDENAWLAAVSANMIAPIMLIRAVVGSMRQRGWGRIINITSTAVKAPLPLLGLSNGARSGLTGFVAGIAREVAADGVTINGLLPGNFDTDRLDSYIVALSHRRGVTPDQARAEIVAANPAKRIGTPEEFGAACAFLASVNAGYINGQNLLLDGGAFPGTL